MGMRRVVVGQAADGRSVVASDEDVAPITATLLGDGGFYRLWGGDEPVKLPQDGAPVPVTGWFPPAGGFRFATVVFAPEAPPPADLDMDAAITELGSRVPGLVEVLEPDNPLMHTTDTIDLGYVASGEIWLELDDGAEVHLSAGDCIVQCGTRHAWHNRSAHPCELIVAMVGAAR